MLTRAVRNALRRPAPPPPDPSDRTERRVAIAQAQARPTLLAAAAFALAAAAAALVPSATGSWLPLHLFLVGSLLSAISAATQLFAVTWSAAPAPPARLVSAQRWCVVVGAVAVAGGREADVGAVTGAGAVLVVAGLALLAVSLLGIRRGSGLDRFHPAIDAYLLAVGLGIGGVATGAAMALGSTGDWSARVRGAHLTLNVLGLVGIVVAGTLPYFVATQARMKMSRRARPARLRAHSAVLGAGTVVAATGHLLARPGLAAAGVLVHLGGLVAVAGALPRPGHRQLAWAGPRLLQLATGGGWWITMVAALGVSWTRDPSMEGPVLRALAVGGFAQILVASLAYLGPVVRGGGHERLAAGFAITASWPGLVLGNLAGAALLIGASPVAAAAAAAWALDTGWRGVRLLADDGPVEQTR